MKFGSKENGILHISRRRLPCSHSRKKRRYSGWVLGEGRVGHAQGDVKRTFTVCLLRAVAGLGRERCKCGMGRYARGGLTAQALGLAMFVHQRQFQDR